MSGSDQTDLFAGGARAHLPPAVTTAPVPPRLRDLASRLPEAVRFGTSSWSFPGWHRIVYDRAATPALLARDGLFAYAGHPLLRAVGVDRTYYGPLRPTQFAEYAAAVPPDFRFVVKADRAVTTPTPGTGRSAGEGDPFLDPSLAQRSVVDPAVAGLGDRLGALVFQFPPFRPSEVGGVDRFVDRLAAFLGALPTGPTYAVEIRSAEVLGSRYAAALASAGAAHTYSVHPTLPTLEQQARIVPPGTQPVLVVRWMLGHGLGYDAARERYAPFDRLVAEDPASRSGIARLCLAARDAGVGALVTVNNKAEGCSPLSVFKLAELLADLLTPTTGGPGPAATTLRTE